MSEPEIHMDDKWANLRQMSSVGQEGSWLDKIIVLNPKAGPRGEHETSALP